MARSLTARPGRFTTAEGKRETCFCALLFQTTRRSTFFVFLHFSAYEKPSGQSYPHGRATHTRRTRGLRDLNYAHSAARTTAGRSRCTVCCRRSRRPTTVVVVVVAVRW